MMKTIKTMLISCFLFFSLSAVNTGQAGAAGNVMDQRISTVVTHLEAARKALAANEGDAAQEHMKAAGQSSKNITGGSFEVKAQRGSRAIAYARRLVREGDNAGAAASLEEAEGIYKSLLQPAESGGRGGLN